MHDEWYECKQIIDTQRPRKGRPFLENLHVPWRWTWTQKLCTWSPLHHSWITGSHQIFAEVFFAFFAMPSEAMLWRQLCAEFCLKVFVALRCPDSSDGHLSCKNSPNGVRSLLYSGPVSTQSLWFARSKSINQLNCIVPPSFRPFRCFSVPTSSVVFRWLPATLVRANGGVCWVGKWAMKKTLVIYSIYGIILPSYIKDSNLIKP